MDNAKYHRREYQAQVSPTDEAASADEPIRTIDDYLRLKIKRGKGKGRSAKQIENEAPQKSLSQLKKEELVQRIAPLLAAQYPPLTKEVVAAALRNYSKSGLYDLARKPENALPLSTEVIAQ
ncbi:hypothetical protein BGZ74_006023, partial [Mortierella antarctica]